MRILVVTLLVALFVASGCSTHPHSFLNGPHLAKSLTFLYDDLHAMHEDIDHVLLGICDGESLRQTYACSKDYNLNITAE